MTVITISRQFGSGGDQIAALVSDMLGYYLFDKTMMVRMASEVGLAASQVVDFTETDMQDRSLFDRLFARRPSVAEIRSWREDTTGVRTPEIQRLDEEQAVAMVQGTIQAAYRRGNMVIVGRGGQAILRDRPGVLHVRIEAPKVERVLRTQEQDDLLPHQAELLVEDNDRLSQNYLRRFYNIAPSDSQHYHLVLNTGQMDQETAARLIVTAVQLMEQRTAKQAARQRNGAPVEA